MTKGGKIKPGYKPSPLGPIPIDWITDTIVNVSEFGTQNGFYKGKEFYGRGYEMVHMVDIFSSDTITEGNMQRVDLDKNEIEKFKLKEGDLLFARRSLALDGVGKCAIVNNLKSLISFESSIIRITPNKKILNPLFGYYFICSYKGRAEMRKIARQVTISGIASEDLKFYQLPIPKIKEQTAIANLLSTWDRAITHTTQLIAQKELRKKWLMQQLLTGKKRLKGFKGEWKDVKLREVFNEIKDTNDGNDTHSIMTISARLGLISQEDKFDRVIAGDSLKKYTQLKRGDFAYNKGNSKTYQMGCVYQLEEKKSALVPFVYICFSPISKIDSKFYKHWFLAHGLDRQLNRIITSGARGDGLLNVNTEDFFKLTVPFPSKEEQTAIANVLQTADKELQLLRQKLDQLKEQKKGLMQVLLTGQKRLKI